MVVPAEQGHVVEVGFAAVGPVVGVVDFSSGGFDVTTGHDAAFVSDGECFALVVGGHADPAALGEGCELTGTEDIADEAGTGLRHRDFVSRRRGLLIVPRDVQAASVAANCTRTITY